MTQEKISIIYMGTPDFAVGPLQALCENGFDVKLAVTQTDKKKGRGKKVLPPPVKTVALELGIEVFQPKSIKTSEAIEKLKSYEPDFLIVAAYGQILSKEVLDIPKKGCINIHASLLPKYRGASPIQHAVLNCENETGVTTMLMDEGLDTGDMLYVVKTPISQNDTAGSLHDKLSKAGCEAIVHTINNFDTIKNQKQDNTKATYAPLLKKEDGHIDWSKKAHEIDAKIRAFNPWPGTFTFYNEDRIKIYDVEITDTLSGSNPGEILKTDSDILSIATGDYNINITDLQSAGKKRMKVSDFLKGYKIVHGMVLT